MKILLPLALTVALSFSRRFVQKETKPPGRVLSLMPQVVAWLGLPVGNDMEKSPGVFLGTENISQIQSYDHLAIEHLNVGASGNEEGMVERLRALRYLEGQDSVTPVESTSP